MAIGFVPFRLLFTGGADWEDKNIIFKVFREIQDSHGTNVTLIYSEPAMGADLIAVEIAEQFGWNLEPHRAHWVQNGRDAGVERNNEMVTAGASMCVGFMTASSEGSRHLTSAALHAGIPTLIVEASTDDPLVSTTNASVSNS